MPYVSIPATDSTVFSVVGSNTRVTIAWSSLIPPLAGCATFHGTPRERHPLAAGLKTLFRAEEGRFDELTTALRAVFVESPVRALSAWIQDPATASRGTDAITLYFVAMPEDKDTLLDYLNERLPAVERSHDLHVVVTALTRSELETLSRSHRTALENPTLLEGVPPIGLLAPDRSGAAKPAPVSHDEHDARARRLALAIAVKIKKDPGLIVLAQNRLERRRSARVRQNGVSSRSGFGFSRRCLLPDFGHFLSKTASAQPGCASHFQR